MLFDEGYRTNILPQENTMNCSSKNANPVNSRDTKKAGHKMAAKQLPGTQNIDTDVIRVDEGGRLLGALVETPRSTSDLMTPPKSPARIWSPNLEYISSGQTEAAASFADAEASKAVISENKHSGVRRHSQTAETLSASQCHSYSSFWGIARPLDPFKEGGLSKQPLPVKPVVNNFMFMKYC
jgi:hypothetical protein